MKTRALFVLGLIFCGSFIGRIAVMASDAASADAPADPAQQAGAPADACIGGELAAAVKDRMSALDGRERKIADREAELKTYERQVDKRLAELEEANNKLQTSIKIVQDARNADIQKLAAIYAGMKPAQAGGIINEMDAKFAAGLISSMNSEQAAQIVANMDSQKAYLVSVILANRTQGE
ncbi:MotE family protein [Hyphococcus sp.]|uniref:MotE family protein n=1 Tax=Hyphococcus sp. TaxID=2038636 RepID=UPI003CCBBF78